MRTILVHINYYKRKFMQKLFEWNVVHFNGWWLHCVDLMQLTAAKGNVMEGFNASLSIQKKYILIWPIMPIIQTWSRPGAFSKYQNFK